MKLNLGPEFLKYLAAHASESGKHLLILEKLAKGIFVVPVNCGSNLKPPLQRDLLRFDMGNRYDCCGVAQMRGGLY